jgi:hypothetical protein
MKIESILNQLGLHQNSYNPCLFTGHVIDPPSPADTPSSVPLNLGIYVYADDFVYFLDDSAEFQQFLKDLISVDFIGTVKWFLGMHFQWLLTPEEGQVST